MLNETTPLIPLLHFPHFYLALTASKAVSYLWEATYPSDPSQIQSGVGLLFSVDYELDPTPTSQGRGRKVPRQCNMGSNKEDQHVRVWHNQLSGKYWLIMHHAVPRGTVVLRGTTLCSAIMRPPEVKSCRIIWCVFHREHIVEIRCDLLGFKCFQRLLSMQFIHNKSFWTFCCAFYKHILHFSNPNTALKNRINNWTKSLIFTWYPRVQFMSWNAHYFHIDSEFWKLKSKYEYDSMRNSLEIL